MDILQPLWSIVAWAAPVLWAVFFVKAVLWRRFHDMPVWICYALMAIPFDFIWALHYRPWTLPYVILGLAMRAAVSIEAVLHMLRAVRDDQGHHYAVMSGLWAGFGGGLATLLHYDPRGWLAWVTTGVRIGCAVSVLVAVASWAGHRLRHIPFCFWHGVLMLAWMSSSAFAAAMDPNHGAAARGDVWDTFAITVRDLTLLGWVWLIGDPMFSPSLPNPDTVGRSAWVVR